MTPKDPDQFKPTKPFGRPGLKRDVVPPEAQKGASSAPLGRHAQQGTSAAMPDKPPAWPHITLAWEELAEDLANDLSRADLPAESSEAAPKVPRRDHAPLLPPLPAHASVGPAQAAQGDNAEKLPPTEWEEFLLVFDEPAEEDTKALAAQPGRVAQAAQVGMQAQAAAPLEPPAKNVQSGPKVSRPSPPIPPPVPKVAERAKRRLQKRAKRPHFGLLRFWQTTGLSLSALMLCGFGFLHAYGQGAGLAAGGQLPSATFLLAGRDVVYCYYRQPCKDQSQTTNLYQPPNTDTLMLIKLSPEGVRVLNIPRDTNIGEYDYQLPASEQKINAQYWIGGPKHLTEKVEEITHERIDGYAVVRTEYVEKVINALGGLQVTVPEGGIEWIDQAAGIELRLSAGSHHLLGKEAVHYLRVRKGVGDDYGRIDHQKQALVQLIAKLKTPQGLLAVPSILAGIDDGVETNIDPKLISRILPQATTASIQFATLPTLPIRNSYNLAVDQERLEAIWNTKPTWSMTKDIQSAPITVWDASGQGLGQALTQALTALGFEHVRTEQLEDTVANSQVFTHGGIEAANQLATLLQLPRLQGERFPVGAKGVGIVLGQDATTNFAALAQAYAKREDKREGQQGAEKAGD